MNEGALEKKQISRPNSNLTIQAFRAYCQLQKCMHGSSK